MALYELFLALNYQPTLLEEYCIFELKNCIEIEMVESDMTVTELSGIDVSKVVNSERHYTEFVTGISKCVNVNIAFWNELEEESPNTDHLLKSGSRISETLTAVHRKFAEMIAKNRGHAKLLTLYGNFLSEIAHNEADAQKYLTQADYSAKSVIFNRSVAEDKNAKYGTNSGSVILIASGNFSSMGIIRNVNMNLSLTLGYDKLDAIGQNVNNFMPKVLGKNHDAIMKNFFITGESKFVNKEKMVYPLNKDGYIIPSSAFLKV